MSAWKNLISLKFIFFFLQGTKKNIIFLALTQCAHFRHANTHKKRNNFLFPRTALGNICASTIFFAILFTSSSAFLLLFHSTQYFAFHHTHATDDDDLLYGIYLYCGAKCGADSMKGDCDGNTVKCLNQRREWKKIRLMFLNVVPFFSINCYCFSACLFGVFCGNVNLKFFFTSQKPDKTGKFWFKTGETGIFCQVDKFGLKALN